MRIGAARALADALRLPAREFDELETQGERPTVLGLPERDGDVLVAMLLAAATVDDLPQPDFTLLHDAPPWLELRYAARGQQRGAVYGPYWWRQRDGKEVLGDVDLHPGRQTDPLYRPEIDLLRHTTPPRVKEMLALLRDEPALYNDSEELARRLGITQNNVWQILYRIKAIAKAM